MILSKIMLCPWFEHTINFDVLIFFFLWFLSKSKLQTHIEEKIGVRIFDIFYTAKGAIYDEPQMFEHF